MAPVAKRFRIDSTGSTSSIGTGAAPSTRRAAAATAQFKTSRAVDDQSKQLATLRD